MSQDSAIPRKQRRRGMVILNDQGLRRVKVRIDGVDRNDKITSRAINVLAPSIEDVEAAILEALKGGNRDEPG